MKGSGVPDDEVHKILWETPRGSCTDAASSSPGPRGGRPRAGRYGRYGSVVRRRATMLLLGAAAAALLSGCTSEVTGSATAVGEPRVPSDDSRHQAFCTDVPVLLQDVVTQLGSVSTDPQEAAQTLDDVVSRMEQVDPPEDVADEWERFITAISEMRDLLASVDPTDPTPDPALTDRVLELQPELIDAGSAIDEWGRTNC
jgi:hypothetical protein